MLQVAILYQAIKAPEIDGISKLLKSGGYSYSGAVSEEIQANNFYLPVK